MLYCETIQRDYFEIMRIEVKRDYIGKKNLESLELANSLLIAFADYRGLKYETQKLLLY